MVTKNYQSYNSIAVTPCFNKCSAWSYCDLNNTCRCYQNTDQKFVCSEFGERTDILSCYCLTVNSKENTTEVGICIYNCNRLRDDKTGVKVDYTPLPDNIEDLNSYMCGIFNRTGTLCGKCIGSTRIRAYSFDMSCISCTPSWTHMLKYIAITLVPSTVLYIVLLMLQIKILSSRLQGFIFFCQVTAFPLVARLVLIFLKGEGNSVKYKFAQFLGSLYGIWNLDFLRILNFDICFPLDSLTVLSLDFIVAVYPLFLMLITYLISVAHDCGVRPVICILKPFKVIFSIYKSNWNVRTCTVDAFSSFMLLSNVKFISTCLDILMPVWVCGTSSSDNCHYAVFYDATIPYLGKAHLPYALLAFVVLLVFVALPIFILFFNSFRPCHRIVSLLSPRWQLVIQMFLDSIQGCFKDGTEPGTRDCRWFSAIPFMMHLFICSVYAAVALSSAIILCAILLTLYAVLIVLVEPHKAKCKYLSAHMVVFLLFLVTIFILANQIPSRNLQVVFIIGGLILVFQPIYISILTIHWISSSRNFFIL